MGLGQNKRCCCSMKLKHGGDDGMDEEADRSGGMREFVRYTRSSSSFGRKRISISSRNSGDGDGYRTPLKRLCSGRIMSPVDAGDDQSQKSKSPIESLPQDILIRILCGVNHDDLKQLIHVSKTIEEACLMAKKWHFAYSTPTKTPAFRTRINFKSPNELDVIEAPNAPKRSRSYRSRLNGNSLVDISVALFASLPETEI